MSNIDLVSSLQALPETDPIEVDGVQFGPTCVNVQGGCLILTIEVAALQTVVGGIGIGVLGTGVGC